jgi:hypothetical protein
MEIILIYSETFFLKADKVVHFDSFGYELNVFCPEVINAFCLKGLFLVAVNFKDSKAGRYTEDTKQKLF